MELCACAVVHPGNAAKFAEYPKPSIYPISWELKFQHSTPKRIVVELPGEPVPKAYWYMTYTVTNNTDDEQTFLPVFEMLTREGKVIRSDNNIPKKVFEAIKAREKDQFLQPAYAVAGELRVGEDQAKDSVAIWEEPEPRMGTFSIFVGGLSGEIAELKDDDGKPVKDKDGNTVILRKTKQLEYQVRGDELYPGNDSIDLKEERWIMR